MINNYIFPDMCQKLKKNRHFLKNDYCEIDLCNSFFKNYPLTSGYLILSK